MAAGAASSLDPESASWALTRLGLYYSHAGSLHDADTWCDAANPAALLLQSRLRFHGNRSEEAVTLLQRAAELNPLPELQWALSDMLRYVGRVEEAANVEALLQRTGGQNDPRTLALFLATRGEQIELAIELAQRELQSRADIFTHDVLAWALAAGGRFVEAWSHMEKALAEGTIDARLFLHAGVLAAKRGHTSIADHYLTKARALQHMLLPSEQEHLVTALNALTIRRNRETLSTREDRLVKASLAEERKDRNEQ